MKIRLSEIGIKRREDGTVDNQRSDFDPYLIGQEIRDCFANFSDDNPYKDTLVQVEQDKVALKYNILPIFTSVRSMGINTVPMMLDHEMNVVTGHVRFACLLGINAEYAEVTVLQHKVNELERALLQGAENAHHTNITPYDWVMYIRKIRPQIQNRTHKGKKITDTDVSRICGISNSFLSKCVTINNLATEQIIERMKPPYNLPFEFVYNFVRQVSKEVQEMDGVLDLLDKKPLPDINVMIWDIERLVMEKRKELQIEPDEDESGRTELTIFDTITNPGVVAMELARKGIAIKSPEPSKYPGKLLVMTKMLHEWSNLFRIMVQRRTHGDVPDEIFHDFFEELVNFLNYTRNGKFKWRVAWSRQTKKFILNMVSDAEIVEEAE